MSSTRAATLQDVADLCGISRGTASRALAGTGRVSAETRRRVLEAAQALSYSTNSGARNLRQARAGSIGLWLPRGMNFMEYYMNFAVGVVQSTEDRELTVSLIPAEFPAAKARALHVDGFVMTDVIGGDELARAILESGRPVVTSELVPPGMPEPTVALAGDHRTAMNRLLDRLRASGATSIAVVRPLIDQMWARLAADAAADWADATGITVRFIDLHGVPSAEELHSMIRGLHEDHPDVDAIVCLPEGLGVGILSTLRELGHAVPDEVQLVAYNDSPALQIVQPPISSLDLRAQDAGMRAGAMLISLIEKADDSVHGTEWFDLIYRERASTRPVSPAHS
ncbi:LacI family transcriptional regulator [Microbacterium foliorum]|uniref:Catabolite control protein A n=1 Tax=Microbacterium foliorum TaxID=104336 RepID=A0A0F0KJS6_9MICO|nr:LacI family DNA-binding transcriptional regulator [Microbacterium foliorum]AXL13155.1 LacI family transcriptional regulator [Microbacterium foliorum]KJL21118.1 Catabolite control protein A [Microbacterium foliorum]